MKFALVLLGVCAFYLVNATGDLEAELEASELQALEETQDLIETPLESLEAAELEEARIKWGKLFSAAKKLYKKGKKLSKNKNFKKALKFGMALAKDLQNGEAREALDFMGETPLESLTAEELEEARKINWGKIFSTAGKLAKKAKKLSKNKNFKKALKFGKQLAANLQNGEEHEPGTPVGNNKCWAIGTKCTEDCDCCPEHHCHCRLRSIFGTRFCSCQVTESDKVNKCPPAEERASE